MKFDRDAPDPSPRFGSPFGEVPLGFSERLNMNGIESGLRALLDGPVHPRAFAVEGKLVWASQYTGEAITWNRSEYLRQREIQVPNEMIVTATVGCDLLVNDVLVKLPTKVRVGDALNMKEQKPSE